MDAIDPGPFSHAVDLVVSVARRDLATRGESTYHAVFVGDGTVHTARFDGLSDELEAMAIRAERKRLGAEVAARAGMGTFVGPDGPIPAGFVYAESASRRERFILPATARGALVEEVDAQGQAISEFFEKPELGALANIQRTVSGRR